MYIQIYHLLKHSIMGHGSIRLTELFSVFTQEPILCGPEWLPLMGVRIWPIYMLHVLCAVTARCELFLCYLPPSQDACLLKYLLVIPSMWLFCPCLTLMEKDNYSNAKQEKYTCGLLKMEVYSLYLAHHAGH